MKQHEAVFQAMKGSGGFMTLGHLYHATIQIPDCHWGTKTPFASIRRIVQQYPQLFFKIRPGLWGLTKDKEEILAKLAIEGQTSQAKVEEFDHSFYQGLLVEIGNLKSYETFVPHQDKNRKYLARKLSDFTTLKEFPNFTYDALLKRARTIDVTWFNKRGLPHFFFEVEHSTDIQNSLLKFTEFEDFRINFRIVADAAREREFARKINFNAFRSLKDTVKFINYDAVIKLHSVTFENAAIEQTL